MTAHVNVHSVDALLAFAAELEKRDAALSERIDVLVELGHQVEEVRVRARAASEALERLPRDREQVLASLAEAERQLEAAEATYARALRDVERARGEDAEASACRHEAHAATDVRTMEDRRQRLVARRDELARAEQAVAQEIDTLDACVKELAAELEAAPRVAAPDPPNPGLEGLADWGARAHAAVFVARSGLETERGRVVREANELAASVLGDPTAAMSVAGIRERLEKRLS
jgi:chromosome segregation ATPase